MYENKTKYKSKKQKNKNKDKTKQSKNQIVDRYRFLRLNEYYTLLFCVP